MRLNLRQIEAFRAVFQTGSMTAAGEAMGVTQPAISRLIRDLEAEIGFPLFDRQGGRVTPTADAVALFQEVQRSFHGLDRVARAAAQLKQRREGVLRIAASVAPSFYCLPNALARFQSHRPGVELSLTTGSSPEVLDLVGMRQADIGVAVVADTAPGVVIEDLPVHDVVCAIPAGHSLAAEQAIRPDHLDGQPLMMISDYSLLQQRIRACLETAGITLNIVFESSFSGPICGLVAEGTGLALLDPHSARAFADDRVVLRPFAPAIPYALKLIRSANRPLPEHAATFVDLLRDQLESLEAPVP